MKDIGIYIGSFSAGSFVSVWIGNLSKFHWWQIFFLAVMILALVMAGGVVGMAIQELILKFKKAWIGKKQQKSHLSGCLHLSELGG